MCWYENLSVKAKSLLNKTVKMSSKILEVQQSMLSNLYTRQVGRKARSILSDATHPLYNEFQTLPSGSRFRFPSLKSNRYKQSSIPAAISVLNVGQGRS